MPSSPARLVTPDEYREQLGLPPIYPASHDTPLFTATVEAEQQTSHEDCDPDDPPDPQEL